MPIADHTVSTNQFSLSKNVHEYCRSILYWHSTKLALAMPVTPSLQTGKMWRFSSNINHGLIHIQPSLMTLLSLASLIGPKMLMSEKSSTGRRSRRIIDILALAKFYIQNLLHSDVQQFIRNRPVNNAIANNTAIDSVNTRDTCDEEMSRAHPRYTTNDMIRIDTKYTWIKKAVLSQGEPRDAAVNFDT